MIEKLKNIIDSSNSTIDNIKDDHKELAKAFNIDITHHYSQKLITDKIIELIIKDLDEPENKKSISITELRNVSKNLVYENLLFDKDTFKYINILETLYAIKNASIKRITSLDNTDKWQRIVSNLINYRILSNNAFDISESKIRDSYPQEFDRVIELKKLKSFKCNITIIDGNIELSEIETVTNKLNNLIKEIGGLTLAKAIFNLLASNNYSNYFERYHLTRNGNGLGIHKKPQVPFGYLLNLSVKYPYEVKKKGTIEKKLLEIQELSIAIVTGIYNVQHYNQWTNFFQTGDTIINYFSEIAMWDSMYSLIQTRPNLAKSINIDLFEIIDDETFKKALTFSKNDYQKVVDSINKFSENKNGPVLIYLSKIYKELKDVEKTTIQTILDLLSHKNKPNKNYELPSDITEVDFQFNPLIKLGKTKFLLMDKSWCSPAFFESIANGLREGNIKNFDSNIGVSIENLIYKNLKTKNIKYSTGDYKVDNINGECDLIVESKETVILFEFKKKVLTRKAKSGIDIDLLIDLSDSILSSQIQAGRTEIILLDKKEINLTNSKNGIKSTIKLNGRSIERVSLTQLDFGGFHDRTTINQFFNALLTHNYGTYSKDKRIIKKFEQLTKKQKIWFEQYEKLKVLDKGFERFPYFNCWFLNLGHLLEIINLSIDNDSFNDKIKSMKFVTFGTLDFYKEFELKNNLNNNASR